MTHLARYECALPFRTDSKNLVFEHMFGEMDRSARLLFSPHANALQTSDSKRKLAYIVFPI